MNSKDPLCPDGHLPRNGESHSDSKPTENSPQGSPSPLWGRVGGRVRVWLLAARPKTLTGAIAPVLVGGAMAFVLTCSRVIKKNIDMYEGLNLSDTILQGRLVSVLVPFVLCLLFALLMQVDANFINDYFDFKIEFYGEARKLVHEFVWSDNQQLEENNEKNMTTLTFTSSQWLPVQRWLLSFGADAKPIEPDWFVAEWKETIRKMAENV